MSDAPALSGMATRGGVTTNTPTDNGNNNANNSRKRKKKPTDPDGSLAVARGNVTRQSLANGTQSLWEHRSEDELQRIPAHLDGPHAFEAQERRLLLQNDDANPDTNSNNRRIMSDHQQRALQKLQT